MVRSCALEPYRGSSSSWWCPESLLPLSAAAGSGPPRLLSHAQLDRFHSCGFLVLDFWPAEVANQAATEMRELLPPGGEDGLLTFPCGRGGELALNQLPLDPGVLAVVGQLMSQPPAALRLSQSQFICKRGRLKQDAAGGPPELTGDQDMHLDFWDNMLLAPARGARLPAVAGLSYFSDVDECAGSTHFARSPDGAVEAMAAGPPPPPADASPVVPATPETGAGRVAFESGWERPAHQMDALYQAERPVRFRAGTLVLYCLDTWHRGTPVRAGQARYTHHSVWRHCEAQHIQYQGFAPGLAQMPPQFIRGLSPTQRALLGIPVPAAEYWNVDTIDAARRRYGMDVEPYVEAMNKRRRRSRL